MMSSIQKGANALKRFKWQWKKESSLTAQLLSDVPPEIELSEYQRLPGLGNESPSRLLAGEGLKAEPIANLDLFFGRLYNYYCEKGLWNIITKWIVEILTITFVVCFIGFFLLVVDWHALYNVKCGVDAVESGQKPCDLAKEAINHHPLVPFTLTKGIIVGSMLILSIYGLFIFLKFFVQFKNILEIRRFYYNSINVTDHEIQTTPWPAILEKVVQLQKSQQLCVVKELYEHDVVMRIMRKENYLIGMLNKGVFAFPISWWVPGAGPSVNSKGSGRKNHLIFTKTLEWTLDWCIFQSMFDCKFCVQSDFLTNPSLLRRRLMVIGIGMLVISPCLAIFMLVYLFLRHAEQFYNQPRIAFFRRWSNLSKWVFREFNEVDHLFKHRTSSSVLHASNYLKQFPSPLISTIAKFISFVAGGFAAVLIIIAILDESLVEGHIFGRKLVWYGAIFTAVTAISRAMVTDELQILDPEGAMSLVVQQTHYMPKKWRGKENSESVRADFESLFQYTGTMLLEEMASIFVTPYLLLFVIPKRVDDILSFISDFTVVVEGVGDVCSLSLFDFESHGNKRYCSPIDATRDKRSSQGKMEKSFLSFRSSYPTWEPSAHGCEFLSNLCNFRDQHLRLELPVRTWHRGAPWYPSRGGALHHECIDMAANELGPLWQPLPLVDQRPHPYLLDYYYTSRPHHPVEVVAESTRLPKEPAFHPTQYLWQPLKTPHSGKENEGDWGGSYLSDRLQSHLEASTSSVGPLGSGILHTNPGTHSASNWWTRKQSSGPETSFIEPPDFNQNHFRHRSFIETPDFIQSNASQNIVQRNTSHHRSFVDPQNFERSNSSHHRSFIDPTNFVRSNNSHQPGYFEPPVFDRSDTCHYGSRDGSDASVEGQEGVDGDAGKCEGSHSLSRTMYLAESDEEKGTDLHFAECLGKDRPLDFSQSNVSQNRSFIDPPDFGQSYSSHQRGFIESRVFGRSDSCHHRSNDGSDASVEGQEGIDGDAGKWEGSRLLSRTMYMSESDEDEGSDLHFAEDSGKDRPLVSNIFGKPLLSLPVRIIPSSNDPVEGSFK